MTTYCILNLARRTPFDKDIGPSNTQHWNHCSVCSQNMKLLYPRVELECRMRTIAIYLFFLISIKLCYGNIMMFNSRNAEKGLVVLSSTSDIQKRYSEIVFSARTTVTSVVKEIISALACPLVAKCICIITQVTSQAGCSNCSF